MNIQQYSTSNINNRFQQVYSKKLSAVVILGHKRHIILSHALLASRVILEKSLRFMSLLKQGSIFGIFIGFEYIYKDKKYNFR